MSSQSPDHSNSQNSESSEAMLIGGTHQVHKVGIDRSELIMQKT